MSLVAYLFAAPILSFLLSEKNLKKKAFKFEILRFVEFFAAFTVLNVYVIGCNVIFPSIIFFACWFVGGFPF